MMGLFLSKHRLYLFIVGALIYHSQPVLGQSETLQPLYISVLGARSDLPRAPTLIGLNAGMEKIQEYRLITKPAGSDNNSKISITGSIPSIRDLTKNGINTLRFHLDVNGDFIILDFNPRIRQDINFNFQSGIFSSCHLRVWNAVLPQQGTNTTPVESIQKMILISRMKKLSELNQSSCNRQGIRFPDLRSTHARRAVATSYRSLMSVR